MFLDFAAPLIGFQADLHMSQGLQIEFMCDETCAICIDLPWQRELHQCTPIAWICLGTRCGLSWHLAEVAGFLLAYIVYICFSSLLCLTNVCDVSLFLAIICWYMFWGLKIVTRHLCRPRCCLDEECEFWGLLFPKIMNESRIMQSRIFEGFACPYFPTFMRFMHVLAVVEPGRAVVLQLCFRQPVS